MTTGFIGTKIYSKHQQQNNKNKTLKEIFTKDRTLKQTEIRVFSMYSARFCKILTGCPHIWIHVMTVWTESSTVRGNSYHEQLLKSHSSNNSGGGNKAQEWNPADFTLTDFSLWIKKFLCKTSEAPRRRENVHITSAKTCSRNRAEREKAFVKEFIY